MAQSPARRFVIPYHRNAMFGRQSSPALRDRLLTAVEAMELDDAIFVELPGLPEVDRGWVLRRRMRGFWNNELKRPSSLGIILVEDERRGGFWIYRTTWERGRLRLEPLKEAEVRARPLKDYRPIMK